MARFLHGSLSEKRRHHEKQGIGHRGLFFALALAGCGGGGGGDDAKGGGTVAITADNAQPLAAEALAFFVDDDGGGATATGVTISGSDSLGAAAGMRLAAAARKWVTKAQGAQPAATLVTGVTTTHDCPLGGTYVYENSGSSAYSYPMNVGDRVRYTYNNCKFDDGSTANGTVKFSIVAGSWDPTSDLYPQSYTMRYQWTNYTDGVSPPFSGDYTAVVNETDAHTRSATSTGTSPRSMTLGSHTVTYSDFTAVLNEDANGSSMSLTASVQTSNSRLGSNPVSYTITTPTAVVVNTSGVVTAGVIKVAGDHSALLLTATGPDSFSLQVDSDGDNIYEYSTTVTRTQLKGQL